MKLRKIVALLLVAVFCLGTFAACGGTESQSTPLVVGYAAFSEKFSPFFADTSYDEDVYAMTQVSLLTTDRTGAIVYKGIEGETIPYNGKDYTYKGISDLDVKQNDDGTVDYTFTLKDGVKFSDGEALTADDVIFSLYVLADPTYDGSSTLYAVPIVGIDEYRAGMESRTSLLIEAGRDNKDFTNWTEEQQTAFWTAFDAAAEKFVQEIVDYCVSAGALKEEDATPAAGLGMWGFTVDADATAVDCFMAMMKAYENDYVTLSSTESAGSSFTDLLFADLDAAFYQAGVKTGDSADSIEGIKKIDDKTVKVTTSTFDAVAIYQLGISVAPLHYYGSDDAYDYENNQFGFTKGDLSGVKAKTTVPMGAGPYKFVKYENKVVYFEANENYWKGEPKTKNVQFKETAEADKISGVGTGTIDLSDPSFSKAGAEEIATYNSNGDVVGDKLITTTFDFLGYGYIGMNADTVCVDGDSDSDASKNLRKAIATILAVYRDVAIDSYYGEAASIINYPISNTSWAAPQKSDSDYAIAYSKDVDGVDIYTSDMNADDKYAAAKAAALGYFEAAGYTVKDGKLAEAPKGAKLQYEVIIPAEGSGDHPTYAVLTAAKEAFAEIGLDFVINDPADSNVLWDALDAGEQELWVAAWGATVDPDMYQVYHSSNIVGKPGSTNSNHYHIDDASLDKNIMDARSSADQSYRKAVYKACLDTIIDWAVEIPVYQRQECFVYSAERINVETLTPDMTTFWGWMNDIELLEMNEGATPAAESSEADTSAAE